MLHFELEFGLCEWSPFHGACTWPFLLLSWHLVRPSRGDRQISEYCVEMVEGELPRTLLCTR